MIETDPVWKALCSDRDTKIQTDPRNQVIISRIWVLDILSEYKSIDSLIF
jgi:hypothetical protein